MLPAKQINISFYYSFSILLRSFLGPFLSSTHTEITVQSTIIAAIVQI